MGQGKYDEAEPLYREALQAQRETLGERHPNTLTSIGNLGMLLQRQYKYDEAEPLLRKALQACRETLGDRHPNTLTMINNLGVLLKAQSKYDEAEPLLREALKVKVDAATTTRAPSPRLATSACFSRLRASTTRRRDFREATATAVENDS